MYGQAGNDNLSGGALPDFFVGGTGGGFTGFDLINNFTANATNGDVLTFTNGTLDAGELAVVLVGVGANGGAAALNGSGAGLGYN